MCLFPAIVYFKRWSTKNNYCNNACKIVHVFRTSEEITRYSAVAWTTGHSAPRQSNHIRRSWEPWWQIFSQNQRVGLSRRRELVCNDPTSSGVCHWLCMINFDCTCRLRLVMTKEYQLQPKACSTPLRFWCAAFRCVTMHQAIIFYFRRSFILAVEKLVRLQHYLVPVLLQDTECITKYHIIKIATWRIVTERNAPNEKRISLRQSYYNSVNQLPNA